jgi:hypothetical protein
MPVESSLSPAVPDVGIRSVERLAGIQRPAGIGAFQFVILATLRAAQLMRGCRPRVDGTHKATVIAQIEVSEGKVMQASNAPDTTSVPPAISDAPIDGVPAMAHSN